MPGLDDLAPLLVPGSLAPNATASMPGPMAIPAPRTVPSLDLPTQATPGATPGQPQPMGGGFKMPWGELMRTLAPVLGGLAAGGNGPGATGFMQGFTHGQQMAAQERQKREQLAEAKKEQAAKFRMEIFDAARQITDPQEWAQFVDLATDSAMQMGLIESPAEMKSFLQYPAHLESKKKRAAAIARLESLIKAGYDLDQLAEQNASVQLDGDNKGTPETYKVRELITIAGSMPEVDGKFVTPPKATAKPNAPSDYEQSFLRFLKDRGKTLETATSADEFAFKKQLKESTADPEMAEMTKTLKQLQIDAARTRGQGGISPEKEFSMEERLAKAWATANGSAREMQRQHALMQTGLKRFRSGDKNGGSQAVLVTFQKILDPTSVVRESEYARTAAGQSVLNRIEGYADKLAKGGAGMTDGELAAMVETARQFLADMQAHSKGQRRRIEAQVKKYNLDPAGVFDDVLTGETDPAVSAADKLKKR